MLKGRVNPNGKDRTVIANTDDPWFKKRTKLSFSCDMQTEKAKWEKALYSNSANRRLANSYLQSS